MSSQIAKLCLRGSIVNQTLRHMSKDQVDEIEDIINMVVADPLLQQCRIEFCNALKRTIHNEYANIECGEQDYRIAILRAAIAAKHGWHGGEPSYEALHDPIQRKKWFQTWAFNYLRQILRENKIPAINTAERVKLPADSAALHEIGEAVLEVIKRERDVPHRRLLRSLWEMAVAEDSDKGYCLTFDHWSFPFDLVVAIRALHTKYMSSQIEILQTMDGIFIRRLTTTVPEVLITRRQSTLIRETSFNATDDDGEESRRDQLEMICMDKQEDTSEVVDEEDILDKLRHNIPVDALPVFDILFEDTRPPDYTEKFGIGQPRAAHIAEYLGKSPKEVKHLISTIKLHSMALGVGD